MDTRGARESNTTQAKLSPDVLEEWFRRIDAVTRSNRVAQVGRIHRSLKVAVFGPGESTEVPIALGLHQRLAEAYLATKQPHLAAGEMELAAQLAPRDLIVLHLLGLARLDPGDDGRWWKR